MLPCPEPGGLPTRPVVLGGLRGRQWAHCCPYPPCQSGSSLLGSTNMRQRSCRAGRLSLSPSWGAQVSLHEALPIPYNVPSSLPCGLPWNLASPLLWCQWEGPAQDAYSLGAPAAPPRGPGGSSGQGCSSPAVRPAGAGGSLASSM